MQRDEPVEPQPYGSAGGGGKADPAHVEQVHRIIYNYLLPRFDIHRINVTSRQRLEYAFQVWQQHKTQFKDLYRNKPGWRPILQDPRTRLVLYRVWLGAPLLSLWDFSRDLRTKIPLEHIRRNVSFPSDEPWRLPKAAEPALPYGGVRLDRWGNPVREPLLDDQGRPVMPSAQDVRQLKYQLHGNWYDTFMDEAYANHYLEFVSRTAARINLLPTGGFQRMLYSFGVSPDQMTHLGLPPRVDAVFSKAVLNVDYFPFMDGVYRPINRFLSENIYLADKMGLLAPGVMDMLRRGQWDLILSDNPAEVQFPGSDILWSEDWDDPGLRPLMWLHDILASVAYALSRSIIIRVPTFAVHTLLQTCQTSFFVQVPPTDIMTANTRAGVSVVAKDPDRVPRRRFLFFNPPIQSVPTAYIDKLQNEIERLKQQYKENPETLSSITALGNRLRRTELHAGVISCRPEKSLLLRNIHLMSLQDTNRLISELYQTAKPPPPVPPLRRPNASPVQYPSLYLVFASVTVRHAPLRRLEKRLLPEWGRPSDIFKTDPLQDPRTAYMERIRPSHLAMTVPLQPNELTGPQLKFRVNTDVWWQSSLRGGYPLRDDETDTREWIRIHGIRRNADGEIVDRLETYLFPEHYTIPLLFLGTGQGQGAGGDADDSDEDTILYEDDDEDDDDAGEDDFMQT